MHSVAVSPTTLGPTHQHVRRVTPGAGRLRLQHPRPVVCAAPTATVSARRWAAGRMPTATHGMQININNRLYRYKFQGANLPSNSLSRLSYKCSKIRPWGEGACHVTCGGHCVCVGGDDVPQLSVSPVRAVGSAARAPAGPVAAGESDDGRIATGRTKLISLTPPVSRAWSVAALSMRRPRGEATLGEWLGEIGEASGDGLCNNRSEAAA